MKPDLHCFLDYIPTFLFSFAFPFLGGITFGWVKICLPQSFTWLPYLLFLGVFFFRIKVLEEEKYSLEMKKENGEVPKSWQWSIWELFSQDSPWGSKRSTFKYFIVVVIIVIIIIITIIIIVNLEIVEAVLVNIVELFPDPEDLSGISISINAVWIFAINVHIWLFLSVISSFVFDHSSY